MESSWEVWVAALAGLGALGCLVLLAWDLERSRGR